MLRHAVLSPVSWEIRLSPFFSTVFVVLGTGSDDGLAEGATGYSTSKEGSDEAHRERADLMDGLVLRPNFRSILIFHGYCC
mmetsp:Transcript_18991/g.26748  ORF Transcript_18991/g.26748 Transcript_18991/m.26748 type:complete len:81 (-) Transcript_18991:10-252(-)